MITLHDLLQSPYTRNFFLLFPFLLLGGLIVFLLTSADTLRIGAGLQPPPQVDIDIPAELEEPVEEPVREQVELDIGDEEVDVAELLAEAAGGNSLGEDDDDVADDDGRPGPAQPRPLKPRGIVGKKKAKNLEMRDRRRAYNEFIQNQARDRRARERALEAESQPLLYAEKQRRALAEIAIEKRKAQEREAARALEAQNAQSIKSLRAVVAAISEGGECGKISFRTLGHRIGKDEEWVRRTMKEHRIALDPAGNGSVVALVTKSGWLVRVGKEEIAAIAERVENAGKMSWEDVGTELESRLKRL
ncbi:hypothetical protein ABW21_db0203489 [Orbilia brochopaga]|nr:hypothetical protein ABW21_db0203489 [Drechslerella brochopaga]